MVKLLLFGPLSFVSPCLIILDMIKEDFQLGLKEDLALVHFDMLWIFYLFVFLSLFFDVCLYGTISFSCKNAA